MRKHFQFLCCSLSAVSVSVAVSRLYWAVFTLRGTCSDIETSKCPKKQVFSAICWIMATLWKRGPLQTDSHIVKLSDYNGCL